MIVDDEYYFREALKVSLDWEKIGFTICGEAKNGNDALNKVAELNPDIVLVDINMPVMDGLEFAHEVRNKGFSCKIVILTGHSEFQYAKQALQLGVHNYLLKPVNEKDLMEALFDIKKIIERERNIKIEFNKLKEQVKKSIPQIGRASCRERV